MSSLHVHFVPGYKFVQAQVEGRSIRKQLLQEQKSFINQIARRHPKSESDHVVGFLHDSSSVRRTFCHASKQQNCQRLNVLVHGSGGSYTFGYEESRDFAITAPKLASILAEHLLSIDVAIEVCIDLMFCNSATDTKRYNFARDLSRHLTSAGLPDAFVSGYTGFVLEKGKCHAANGKFSCCNSPVRDCFKSHHEFVQHCSLADARATYLEGSMLEDAKRRLHVLHPGAVLGPGWF